jgi:branched-chain amino acid transport system ATP-binding protein
MNYVVQAEHMHVRYGHSVAVKDISLSVGEGELLAIAGANGAGKSTLVNAIAGWSRATPKVSGTVTFMGDDVSGLRSDLRARRGIALVPESRGAFAEMTVHENLSMVEAKNSEGKNYEIEDIFGLFPRLKERRSQRAGTLSGGERQMLAIGRALRAAPSLLILDEPSVGLAPRLVVEVLQHVKELTKSGLAVLLVEQNVRAALEVADRLSLIEQGEITASGTADEMREDDRTIRAYLGGLGAS